MRPADVPCFHTFDSLRTAALAITAFRNEATTLDALQRHDDAAVLRAESDRLERHTFAIRPVHYMASRAEIVMEDA